MGMTPGPSAQDDRRFAARVLSDVIGDSDGSRFYWALVDPAIAEDADFGFYPHDGSGSFYISLTADRSAWITRWTSRSRSWRRRRTTSRTMRSNAPRTRSLPVWSSA